MDGQDFDPYEEDYNSHVVDSGMLDIHVESRDFMPVDIPKAPVRLLVQTSSFD